MLLLTSTLLATLLDGREVRMEDAGRVNPEHLPGTLSNYSLRYRMAA